jgi:uncharacterized protein
MFYRLAVTSASVFLCLLPLAGAAQSPAPPATSEEAKPPEDTIRQENVMIPARDGVLLATDIYRPAHNGEPEGRPLPVLLHRTPYDKSEKSGQAIARFFAQRGYVVLVQDIRGRHASQGVFEKYYKYDAYDGYDTIEWAAKQPFSNGKVGMYGTSYAAHTQADASKLAPPHLTTMVLNMGGMSSAWNHSVRYDGAFEMGRQLTWAWGQALEDAKDSATRKMLTAESVTDWYNALPLRKGQSPLAIAPVFEGYYLDEATHADYGPYWQTIGMQWERFYAQTADVPMLHVGGWYDIYLRGTIQNWRSLGALKKSPEKLLIGPWTHHGNKRSYAGDVEFGEAAALKDFDLDFHLRWFGRYLKGEAATDTQAKAVRYFLMGTGDGHKDAAGRMVHGGEWRDSDRWPPADAKAATFYLHGDGTLSTSEPAKAEPVSTTYQFDPAHPVPSIGGGVSARLKDGAYDQRERKDMPGSRPPFLPLKSRSDVLVFETEPLTEDVAIAGPVEVRLYASSTGVDTDFTAKLVDVYPPNDSFPQGFDMNLTDGILRVRYRGDAKVGKLMKPGQVYAFTIRPFDTANVFKKGHRIRLDISSSNFPRFDVNPNTGEPLGESRRMVVVDNAIYHDLKRASQVRLWLSPAR